MTYFRRILSCDVFLEKRAELNRTHPIKTRSLVKHYTRELRLHERTGYSVRENPKLRQLNNQRNQAVIAKQIMRYLALHRLKRSSKRVAQNLRRNINNAVLALKDYLKGLLLFATKLVQIQIKHLAKVNRLKTRLLNWIKVWHKLRLGYVKANPVKRRKMLSTVKWVYKIIFVLISVFVCATIGICRPLPATSVELRLQNVGMANVSTTTPLAGKTGLASSNKPHITFVKKSPLKRCIRMLAGNPLSFAHFSADGMALYENPGGLGLIEFPETKTEPASAYVLQSKNIQYGLSNTLRFLKEGAYRIANSELQQAFFRFQLECLNGNLDASEDISISYLSNPVLQTRAGQHILHEKTCLELENQGILLNYTDEDQTLILRNFNEALYESSEIFIISVTKKDYCESTPIMVDDDLFHDHKLAARLLNQHTDIMLARGLDRNYPNYKVDFPVRSVEAKRIVSNDPYFVNRSYKLNGQTELRSCAQFHKTVFDSHSARSLTHRQVGADALIKLDRIAKKNNMAMSEFSLDKLYTK